MTRQPPPLLLPRRRRRCPVSPPPPPPPLSPGAAAILLPRHRPSYYARAASLLPSSPASVAPSSSSSRAGALRCPFSVLLPRRSPQGIGRVSRSQVKAAKYRSEPCSPSRHLLLRGVRFWKPWHSCAGHIRALVLVLTGAAAVLVVVAKVKVSVPQADLIARHIFLRKKVSGTTERPRLSVFRSNKHLYAQVIDDTKSCTLVPASTMHKSLSKDFEYSARRTIGSVAKEVAMRGGWPDCKRMTTTKTHRRELSQLRQAQEEARNSHKRLVK